MAEHAFTEYQTEKEAAQHVRNAFQQKVSAIALGSLFVAVTHLIAAGGVAAARLAAGVLRTLCDLFALLTHDAEFAPVCACSIKACGTALWVATSART